MKSAPSGFIRTARSVAQHGGIAPTRWNRTANDAYFTLDSDRIIPALLSRIAIKGPVIEPAAGVGHMALALRRAHGLAVTASDLHRYEGALIPDIDVCDLREIDYSGFNWAITNLPYAEQDSLAAHLVSQKINVALLTRAEWFLAGKRRQLVHENPRFAGAVMLTSRPRWSEVNLASPRHYFAWLLWQRAPRGPGVAPRILFAGRKAATE